MLFSVRVFYFLSFCVANDGEKARRRPPSSEDDVPGSLCCMCLEAVSQMQTSRRPLCLHSARNRIVKTVLLCVLCLFSENLFLFRFAHAEPHHKVQKKQKKYHIYAREKWRHKKQYALRLPTVRFQKFFLPWQHSHISIHTQHEHEHVYSCSSWCAFCYALRRTKNNAICL